MKKQPQHDKISMLLNTINYKFINNALLTEALMHRSAHIDQPSGAIPLSNERFEFLGDAVLSLALSQALIQHPKNYNEGDLSQIRSTLVNEQTLAGIAESIGLNNHIVLSLNEEKSGGRQKPSLLADALEALIGAVFLDSNFARAQQLILELYAPLLAGSLDLLLRRDYKSRLQEFIQNRFKDRPDYILVDQQGPEHQKEFSVRVTFNSKILGQGTGMSKKLASQNAAKSALSNLNTNPHLLDLSFRQ